MKQKRIEYLINQSGVLGFDFENAQLCVSWDVTPGAGKMLARRTAEDNYNAVDKLYVAIPYADLGAIDDLYDDIVIDFVETNLSELRRGTAVEMSLFDDIASPHDEGLLEMLSFFGRTYGEFMCDVFYWFSVAEEVDYMIEAAEPVFEPYNSAEDHLVRKVLDHLGEHWLYVSYDASGAGAYWIFAKANGQIWFSTQNVDCFDFGYYMTEPIYGHVDVANEDAMSVLRDAVLTDFMHDEWELEESEGALALLGIDENDL